MVLTAAQTTAFFEAADQMAIPHATVVQMVIEGITTVDDLAEFDKDSLQQLADNLRRPGGRVPHPDINPPDGTTIPTPPFTFGIKSQKRLLVATDLVKYYDATGRALTAGNLQWNHVMKNFEVQWKALKAKKEEDPPDVPKISRALPVIKWTEAFKDFLARVIGVRTIPLSYVIRPEVTVPAAAPPLVNNQPHSDAHGSVEAELVARASHGHALYRDDNATVYHYLEEATRTTSYAASIKPFQRAKNGRGAWLALVNQYAGVDKWEAEIKKQEAVLHTRKWKGQSNFTLEAFISQHRNAFVSMQACAEHVQFQLPNGHSRVGYLLEAIECSDAGLQAAMASVRTDTGANGKRSDFEATATHLLPYDPVAKKRAAGQKRGNADISAAETEAAIGATAATPGSKTKPSIGKTGVHLRWHTKKDYAKLSRAQKLELKEWREANPEDVKPPAADKSNAKGQYMSDKQISSLVNKKVKFALEKQEEEKQKESKEEAYIMSLLQKTLDAQASVSANTSKSPAPSTSVDLKSILKRVKNSQN